MIIGQMNGESACLNASQFHKLAEQLPVLFQLYNWNRIYQSSEDGCSFRTLMNKVKSEYPLILLVK